MGGYFWIKSEAALLQWAKLVLSVFVEHSTE